MARPCTRWPTRATRSFCWWACASRPSPPTIATPSVAPRSVISGPSWSPHALFRGRRVRHLRGHQAPLASLARCARGSFRSLAGAAIAFDASYLNFGVLGASVFFEALSFRVAFREFPRDVAGQAWKRCSSRPRIDHPARPGRGHHRAGGPLGGARGGGVEPRHGQSFWDPLGSIIIGVLLTGVAIVLAKVTHGCSSANRHRPRPRAGAAHRGGFSRRGPCDPDPHHALGPDVIILALKIAFSPELRVAEIETATNELEARLRAELPDMKKIFVEPDSAGDGRGWFLRIVGREGAMSGCPGQGRGVRDRCGVVDFAGKWRRGGWYRAGNGDR